MPTTGTDAAAETTKQLITLSTALIGLTVTFLDKFRSQAPDGTKASIEKLWQIELSWLAFGVVILTGLWTLMAITGEIDEATLQGRDPSAMRSNIRIPATLMVLAFLTGMCFVIAGGFSKFA